MLPVNAQGSDVPIAYGETITGEITNKDFEIPYVFTGSQGDVILIKMTPVDTLGDLNSPAIILLDADYSMLGTAESYGGVILAAKLPTDGNYTILATREDGRAGDSVGEYTLTLLKPDILQPDVPVQASVTSESVNYYVVEPAGAFELAYEKLSGDFYPSITVSRLNDESALEDIALIEGEQVKAGSVVIEPLSTITSETYFVTVKEGLWDWNFDEVTADYSLTLTAK